MKDFAILHGYHRDIDMTKYWVRRIPLNISAGAEIENVVKEAQKVAREIVDIKREFDNVKGVSVFLFLDASEEYEEALKSFLPLIYVCKNVYKIV